jgi:hypothetical protein
MSEISPPAALAELDAFISAAFATQVLQNPSVVAVERIADAPPSWYVRFSGTAKENFSAEFELGQRSLHFSSYFIPPPQDNRDQFYRHLLQRNAKLYGMAYTVGKEDAIFLEGRLANQLITAPDELDRLLGSIYAYTEEHFIAAARIGFASRFA